jgi:hypothetical protein
VSGTEDPFHPQAPSFVEASGPEDSEKAGPVDRVEDFAEVDFKNNGVFFPGLANLKEISGVHNVLIDASPREEPSLISIDEGVNSFLQPGSKNFSDGLHDTL